MRFNVLGVYGEASINLDNHKLIGDRVLVLPLVETKTASGIVIANQDRDVEDPMFGFVLKASPNVTDVKYGDKVLFMNYLGSDYILDDFKVKPSLCRIVDILAVEEMDNDDYIQSQKI